MKGFLQVVGDVAEKVGKLCKVPVWTVAEPPATEDQEREVERDLGYPRPPALRTFFRSC